MNPLITKTLRGQCKWIIVFRSKTTRYRKMSVTCFLTFYVRYMLLKVCVYAFSAAIVSLCCKVNDTNSIGFSDHLNFG